MYTRILTLSAVACLAAAQLNLSQACTNTLVSIASNPDVSACLNPSALLTIATDTSKSIVDPINNWLTGLCAAPACSNNTLAAIVANATNGCQAELAGLGFQASDAGAVTGIVQQYYPTARKVVCLKDGNTNCVTQTLTNLQTFINPLSIQNIISTFTSSNSPFGNGSLPTNLTCTNCIKAEYNTIDADVPGALGLWKTGAQQQCGAAFVDGTTPAGISQSASTKTAADTQGSGALSLGALSAASFLVAITTGFTVMA
ncbi:hypothetical protein LshimejAT787_0805420 [Lyophyllum shimeji]|uniref:Secreted protein n=1 Tax=Lyophyllum shimeji TaxID=47721 RepID=A0A9P3PS15_LYOSH|nr:hypothetical protein LshimejAT787_0805420 [Lyophyllum shimeji]